MKISFFNNYRVRIAILAIIGLAGFGILLAKLYFEQIRRSGAYRERISRQMLRRIRIPGQRGKILTSDLMVLADNRPCTAVVFYPEEMRRPGRNSRQKTIDYMFQAARTAAAAAGRTAALSRSDIARHLNLHPGLPLTVFTDLSAEEAARILETTRRFDGIGIEPAGIRHYPRHRTACHILGYASMGNPVSALDRREYFYYVPDPAGRSGMEKLFDSGVPKLADSAVRGLRGEAGFELVQVDSLGFVRNSHIDYALPRNGNHLILSIHSKAQLLAEQALRGRRGALVAVDAETGAVLAMASSPGFDLQSFSPVLARSYYRTLLDDSGKPLLFRAVSGCYTPGSIIKVLVAMALLENGVDPEEKVECQGYVTIGKTRVHCAATHGHGFLNLREAIEKSCNVYFMVKGMRLGREKIAQVLASAGIGETSGLELPHAAGIFPDAERKKLRTGSGWNVFDTALLSIGQGYITVTPLQAAMYMAAILNGGKLMQPYLVESVVDTNGGTLFRTRPQVRKHLAVSPEHLQIVRDGMFRVVHSPQGSGRKAQSPIVSLIGKTGSAEVGSKDRRYKNVWFIAGGTVNSRPVAAAMVLEHGRAGGTDCAPEIAEFFEKLTE